ncbi:hypothetical protein VB773_15995 [Haloarculaceae archaeon H-GB2-1]|nr:hypothetical protein [Haloarculaceae archaeon H-GB11]MEA5408917.1 hypothetical protein [Haloarculaceae archaeon H-GB2-1]
MGPGDQFPGRRQAVRAVLPSCPAALDERRKVPLSAPLREVEVVGDVSGSSGLRPEAFQQVEPVTRPREEGTASSLISVLRVPSP